MSGLRLAALALAAAVAAAPPAWSDEPAAPASAARQGTAPDAPPAETAPAAAPVEPAAGAPAADAAARLDDFERRLRESPDDLLLGADYRQAAVAAGAYDRSIAFFEGLVAAHPDAANAQLNLGYAYVDKIPAAGAVTQVILANTALGHFTASLEIHETWLGLYTRGNSYVYWPRIFGRTRLGIADLEKAIALAETLPPKPYHAHAWAALGDAWWRLGDLDQAHDVWRRGRERFPDDSGLAERSALEGAALDAYLDAVYALGNRVETDLGELRAAP